MTHPYRDTWQTYRAAGWDGTIPLPAGRKHPPPNGTTGADGHTPSWADCQTWADTQPDANIALRLPDGVIGIDVDAYSGKPGHRTLTELTTRLGPLPPTWTATSRDGVSGIRLYRVPPGTRYTQGLPGIDIIQNHHRYVVAPPSVHPNGGVYRWHHDTDLAGGVPEVAALPRLPEPWLQHLTNPNPPNRKTDADPGETLAGFPPGDPCNHIKQAAAAPATSSGSRHDTYNHAILAVAHHARAGCPGGQDTIRRLARQMIAEISDRTTPAEAAAEAARSIQGATRLVANTPQGHGCPDDMSWIPERNAPDAAAPGDPADWWTAAVERKAAELRIIEEAREHNQTRATASAAPLTPTTATAYLAQPDSETVWRVTDLWPAQGRVLLVAAAKTGKTTMVARNLLPALADGGTFLGRYRTLPEPDRNILLLNMEVGDNTLRRWIRTAGINNTDNVYVASLRGRTAAADLSTPAARRRFAAMLTDHNIGTVILDPLAPLLASMGLVEDSNHDVARFFAWWSEALADAGVTDDLICHHAGHDGQRSRGASRLLDEPDAIWTIRRDETPADDTDPYGPMEVRHMRAVGRDVDLADEVLSFNPATGALSLSGTTPGGAFGALRRRRREETVLRLLADAGGSMNRTELVRAVGGRREDVVRLVDEMGGQGRILIETGLRGSVTAHLIAPDHTANNGTPV